MSNSTRPMKEYQCNYPNEVHQLLVSVSKNYYVRKDGIIKYQSKPLPYDLATVDKSDKTRIIHFIMRDHYSGFYYAEMCLHTEILNIGKFLYNAWSDKNNYEFKGAPKFLMVPKIVEVKWSSLKDIVEKFGIKLFSLQSGFANGIIEIKYWQKAIRNFIAISRIDDHTFDEKFEWLKSKNIDICNYANKVSFESNKESRYEKWKNNIKTVYVPTKLSSFILTEV